MAAFQKLGDYTNGTANDGSEVTTEFNNIYNAFNGTSSDKEMERKLDHGTEPCMVFNQVGAGPIIEGKQNSNLKFTVGNDGKIANDNVTKHKELWFLQDPNSVGGEFLKVWIAPSGTGMRMTKLSIIRVGGGHSGGHTATFQFNRNGVGVAGTIAFSDANNLANTEYSVALNQALSAGDKINPTVNPVTAPGERDITILLEWEQKLG